MVVIANEVPEEQNEGAYNKGQQDEGCPDLIILNIKEAIDEPFQAD